MVHSIGGVKMAVMARFLSAARLPQTKAAEQQKLVSQYIQKELCEADEANLLDEKDMHVFDLKPMSDPLYLVRCNACKKPIKASQYAAHAELCRSLLSTEEFLSERDGDAGQKKPPRMERKRSKAAGTSLTGAQERYETIDPFDAAASRSHSTGQDGPASILIVDAKDGSRSATLSRAHGNCLTSANTNDSAAAIIPLSKRPKLLAADMVQSSDGIVTARDVSTGLSSKNLFTYAAAPLATKMYYSQRNNRLRAAFCYLYHEGGARRCSGGASPKVPEGNFMSWEVSSPRIVSEEQLTNQSEELNRHILPSLRNPNQKIAQHSGLCLDQMGGCQPVNNLPNQLIVNDVSASQTPVVEMIASKYSSKPYSYAANSGAALTPIQQSDGSVPVV